MTDMIAASAFITLLYALFAVFGAWCVLRMLDRLGGLTFSTVLRRIASEPMPAAIYYGTRFMGVCLLVGLVVS